jgi:uncharacterized protein (UPF0212 family)
MTYIGAVRLMNGNKGLYHIFNAESYEHAIELLKEEMGKSSAEVRTALVCEKLPKVVPVKGEEAA